MRRWICDFGGTRGRRLFDQRTKELSAIAMPRTLRLVE